jgi:glycosyltransferase involved in cell wall biosynthesis
MQPPLLIAFSRTRWGFVYQRPQHLLSRLAGRWQVIFVEEPVHDPGEPWLEERWLDKHLTVLVPHTPLKSPGFHDDQLALLQTLLAHYLRRTPRQVDVAWLYMSAALPLAQSLRPSAIVYDCMDEPSARQRTPHPPGQCEAALLKQVALVLTGGPSLYETRRDRHPNVVCLPSAVDARHYAPDRLNASGSLARQAQQLQGHLPRPRLGFFGVIDERLDVRLVAQLADAHPEWTLVMAGPVVGIDPASLPHRPNIHWLGIQPYMRLPYLLAGWDLCLMPFALNESTRHISPAKTLEYMAGGKPVVSTAVRDVVWMYSDAVTIAASGKAFVEACEALLAESPVARAQRELQMMALVSASSWDRSAQAVHELMLEALAQPKAREHPHQIPSITTAPRRAAAGG